MRFLDRPQASDALSSLTLLAAVCGQWLSRRGARTIRRGLPAARQRGD